MIENFKMLLKFEISESSLRNAWLAKYAKNVAADKWNNDQVIKMAFKMSNFFPLPSIFVGQNPQSDKSANNPLKTASQFISNRDHILQLSTIKLDLLMNK